jgi:hypothetical protein
MLLRFAAQHTRSYTATHEALDSATGSVFKWAEETAPSYLYKEPAVAPVLLVLTEVRASRLVTLSDAYAHFSWGAGKKDWGWRCTFLNAHSRTKGECTNMNKGKRRKTAVNS